MKNISNNNHLVSLFHPLGSETVKQNQSMRNIPRNNDETESLKTLAIKVFERNKSGNKPETKTENFVSRPTIDETRFIANTDDNFSKYIELFEERAAIKEFDSGMSRSDAEHYAYLELLHDFISENHPDIKSRFSNMLVKVV
jgi:hypothetical protein